MDNFKEAYDELVHKHLTLKEENERLVGESKEHAGEMVMIFFFGLAIGMFALIILEIMIGVI